MPERKSKLDRLGFLIGQTSGDNTSNEKLLNYARAVEFGRAVGRDIGGGDPERMAPPRVADYVQELFKSSSVKVKISSKFGLHARKKSVILGQDNQR